MKTAKILMILSVLLAGCTGTVTQQPASLETATALPPTDTALPPTATPVPLALSSIDMIDASNGWAWSPKADNSFSLMRTQDAGQTWRDVTPKELPSANPYGDVFLDGQTAWIQFLDSASNANGLARTTDGGATWSVQTRNLTFPSANFHFSDPDNGWAETLDVGAGNAYVSVFETHDGGATWQIIPIASPHPETGLPVGTLHLCNICGDTFHYDPARVVITYGDQATSPGGAVRLAISTDLGKTWTDLKLALPSADHKDDIIVPLMPVFFDQENGAMPVMMEKASANTFTSSLAVYGTQDAGASWISSPGIIGGMGAFATVDFVSSVDAFVACGDKLCATHDGAQSWLALASNLDFDINAAGGEHVAQFDFIDAKTGWAITTAPDGSQPKLWQTTNGGPTWKQLTPILASGAGG